MKATVSSLLKKMHLFIILALLLAGCDSSILKENPKSFLSKDQVFNSPQGAISAVKGIYASLGTRNYYNWWFTGTVELAADYTRGRGSQAPLGNYQWGSQSRQRIGFAWNAIYQSINRANIIIDNVPKVEELSSDLKNQLIGEARFLRALDYFNLVRLWGDVPIKIKPTSNKEGLSTPRSPKDEVYNLIIDDLKFGANNLPDSYDKPNIGRATKWAAKTLLAKVYLTLERWSDAASMAKEVIDSGQFTLVQVHSSEDFQQIYGPEVITNSEEIFSIKYIRTSGLGNRIPWLLHKAGAGYSNGGVYAWFGEPKSWIGKWKKNKNSADLRRNLNLYNGADTVFEDASTPILFRKYRDPQAVSLTGAGNDFPVLRYPSALLIYAEAASQANSGPTSEAYKMVNKVRRRAYGEDPNDSDPKGTDLAPGLSAKAFRDSVLLERAKEFVLEDKRWFDLLRTGRAIKVIQALGKPIQEKHLKWPIPQEEIDNNDSLTQADQNPGW